MLALSTLKPAELAALVPVFEASFLERMRDFTIDSLPRRNRRDTPLFSKVYYRISVINSDIRISYLIAQLS